MARPSPPTLAIRLHLCFSGAALLPCLAAPGFGQDGGEPRGVLEGMLREYFARPEPDDARARKIGVLIEGRDGLLADVLRTKSFVAETGAVARRGIIDGEYRFHDREEEGPNPALFHGPAAATELAPLAVFVPDTTRSAGFESMVVAEGVGRGWFVLLVPDDERDNEWDASLEEHRRHTAPLRDLLLDHRIDPDRVFLVGTGRGCKC